MIAMFIVTFIATFITITATFICVLWCIKMDASAKQLWDIRNYMTNKSWTQTWTLKSLKLDNKAWLNKKKTMLAWYKKKKSFKVGVGGWLSLDILFIIPIICLLYQKISKNNCNSSIL